MQSLTCRVRTKTDNEFGPDVAVECSSIVVYKFVDIYRSIYTLLVDIRLIISNRDGRDSSDLAKRAAHRQGRYAGPKTPSLRTHACR